MRDTYLEGLMPTFLDGYPLYTFSFPAVYLAAHGNDCTDYCPYGAAHLFDGLPSGARDGATAATTAAGDTGSFPVIIAAFRVPAANEADLIAAYTQGVSRTMTEHASGTPKPPTLISATIGGRSVTALRYGDQPGPDGGVE